MWYRVEVLSPWHVRVCLKSLSPTIEVSFTVCLLYFIGEGGAGYLKLVSWRGARCAALWANPRAPPGCTYFWASMLYPSVCVYGDIASAIPTTSSPQSSGGCGECTLSKKIWIWAKNVSCQLLKLLKLSIVPILYWIFAEIILKSVQTEDSLHWDVGMSCWVDDFAEPAHRRSRLPW